MRFAIVGCGRIAKKHILAIESINNAELTAVCDIDTGKLDSLEERVGIKLDVPRFSNYHNMMNKVSVDIISVLTPSGLHPKHVIELSTYKLPIICEKPMALRLSDADKMISACDKNGCRLFVVKQNRYNIPVQKLRRVIDDGILGNIYIGTVRVRWCRDQAYYDQDAWRGTWQLDGGVIANQALHHIDLLAWMLGDPVSVYAKTRTYRADIEADDSAFAIIEFSSGAIGTIEATTATTLDLEGSLSIIAEKGTVVIGGFAVNRLDTWDVPNNLVDNNELSEDPPDVYGFGHKRYIEGVIDSVKNKRVALVDGLEARKSIKLINAIYESMETGKEISMRFVPNKCKLGKDTDD